MAANIAPITEVKRRLGAFIAELGKGGEALYVTQHGRAAAVILGHADYESLMQRLEDLEDLLAMKESLSAPVEEAMSLDEYDRRRTSRLPG